MSEEPKQPILPERQRHMLLHLPRGLRFGVICVNATLPFIGLIISSGFLMLMSSETNGYNLLVAMVGYVVSVALVCILFVRKRDKRSVYFYGLMTTCVTLLCSILWSGLSTTDIALILFAFMGFRRMGVLFETDAISTTNVSLFRFDTVLLVVIGFLFALTQPYVQNASSEVLGEGFMLLLVCYALGRIWTLWTLERVESGTQYASKFGIYVMLGLAVVVAMWGPFALGHLLMIPIALVAAAVVLVLSVLPFHLPASITGRFKNSHNGPSGAHLKNIPPANHISEGNIHVIIGVILAVVLVAVVLLVTRSKKKGEQTDEEAASETGVEKAVERKWVRRGGDYSFIRTSDPVRLAYQAMLKRLSKDEGLQMKPNETPRTFETRATREQKAYDRELRKRYESVRYGRNK